MQHYARELYNINTSLIVCLVPLQVVGILFFGCFMTNYFVPTKLVPVTCLSLRVLYFMPGG